MSNDEIILTPEGLRSLESELEDLKTVKRKELASRIKTAISYGDLKENSEYHSAKEEQGFMETRILTIERMLKKAKVVTNIGTSTVQVGSTVILNDVEFAEKIEYKIVGTQEADVNENKISYESPLGVSLMGKSVGDVISVNAPMGVINYELLEIRV
ncbi:transcription elongation factor GreA [Paenibacillus alginolyticus]|uniref:Transcription elongation factor GreA n=1 Tax=Paenibacillus alginolyticus TaxID=59839 RepID=A0ABT4GJX0_9BACL|nr:MULTISPECIES: transcription elongation factor GreA [Paenibacillus]MCY9664574.1 transcription elongation factor GreA [Paenibacillus alginolyticus]MCY9696495.1 transcription elongation factor GreA [Paenibacillus alginolyticus]MEC0141926.1 transcription elongation factor GreA [Paenibacillus alginolyticus]NRF91735.1 transcription elongation factor GreA [Paenibacillus frigoriresistens]